MIVYSHRILIDIGVPHPAPANKATHWSAILIRFNGFVPESKFSTASVSATPFMGEASASCTNSNVHSAYVDYKIIYILPRTPTQKL